MNGPTIETFSKKVFAQAFVQLLIVLRALIILPILVKTLGKFYYGIWSQIFVTITFFAALFTLRFDVVFVRYFSSESAKPVLRKAFFSMLFVILCVVFSATAILFKISDQVAIVVFDNSELTVFVYVLLCLLVVRTIFLFSLSYYRAKYQIGLYSIFQSVQILGEILILVVTLILLNTSFITALFCIVIFNFFIAFFILLLVLLKLGICWPNLKYLKPFLLFGLPLIPNVGLQWVISFSNRFLITHFINLDSVGIYAASYSLGQMINFFVMPIGFVLYPTVSRLWENKQYEEVKFWMENSFKYYIIFAVPAILGIYYFAPFILTKLATEEFAQHRWIVFLIASGCLFYGFSLMNAYIIHLFEKTKFLLIFFILVASVNLTLNIILIPLIGIEGAALATLISYLVQMSGMFVFTSRRFPFRFPYRTLIKSLISSLFMFAFLLAFETTRLPFQLLLALSGFFLYLSGMFVLKEIGIKEIEVLRNISFKISLKND